MAVNFSEERQNVHSVVVVLPEEGATNPQDESLGTHLNNEICVNFETISLYQTNSMMNKVDDFALCNLHVDIEKGKAEVPKSNEECVAYVKSDDSLAKLIWLKFVVKFMQSFMNQNPDPLKVASKDRLAQEKDSLINRSRKYKRSPSFNSRRVVLLFSVMSSLGTIILILLTLKVKQMSDGSGNP